MLSNYLFVSCNIIGDAAQADPDLQRSEVVSINQIVAAILKKAPVNGIIWHSRGDGGHLAFPVEGPLHLSVELIRQLRSWTKESNVSLRITGCCGVAEPVEGADGRMELVGPGMNLAGFLLMSGSQFNVLVTREFAESIKDIAGEVITVHDRRSRELKNFGLQEVYLLSIKNEFDSEWDDNRVKSDRFLVQNALERNDFLEVIYRAKRLLEINAKDSIAVQALQSLSKKRIRPQSRDTFLYDLFLNLQAGPEMLQAGTLIERRRGERLCEYNDDGETMFLILKGKIGIFLPQDGLKLPQDSYPGELTGELAFALGRRRTASLECLEDTALLAFSYNDLLKTFEHSQAKDQLFEILNYNILSRILENWWDSAPYIAEIEKGGSSESWANLQSFAEVISIPFENRTIRANDKMFSNDGLVVLVRGELELMEEPSVHFKGEDYPILFANFPEDFQKAAADFRIKSDIKLLCISVKGFYTLDHDLFDKIVSNLQKRLGESNTAAPEPLKAPSREQQTKKRHVFISYCHENKKEVEHLRKDLMSKGYDVWYDEDINPGQDWQFEIRKAMRQSDVVLICFSAQSQSRYKSGIYPEALDAIKRYREYDPGSIFLIPVRLSDCDIPPIEIDGTRTLDRIQYVDLFPESSRVDRMTKLFKSIESVAG